MLEMLFGWKKTSIKRSSSRSGNVRRNNHHLSYCCPGFRHQSTTAPFCPVFRLCSLECIMVVIFWKMILASLISYISWVYTHNSSSLLSFHVVALGPPCRSKHDLCLMLLYVCFSSSTLARCYTASFRCWSCEKIRDPKSHRSIQNLFKDIAITVKENSEIKLLVYYSLDNELTA